MTRRRRALKVAKWTALALFLVLAFLCGPWRVIFFRVGRVTCVGSGIIATQSSWPLLQPFNGIEWSIDLDWPSYLFRRPLVFVGNVTWVLNLAHLAVLCGIASAALWYLDRRRPRQPGRCACGYDLTGNVSGRCPECGAKIETI